MDKNTLELAEKLINVLENNGSNIVAQYAGWYFIQAITFTVIGILFPYLMFKFVRSKDKDDDIPLAVVRWLILFVCMLIIGCFIGSVFYPEAYGVHQLIRDLRG